MSLDAAIGQIDQIMQLGQAVADPEELASLTPATASSGGAGLSTGATGASGSSASANQASAFADMLANAQMSAITGSSDTDDGVTDGLSGAGAGSGISSELLAALAGAGTSSTTGLDATGATTAAGATTSATAAQQVQAMTTEADSLLGKPYVWGGGHSGWGPQSGYDCSGFVSAVLHAGGYLSAPQDTQTLPSQPGIATGPGQYVTIYDRTDAGLGNDHVIIDIDGQFYESGGEHGAWGGGGGVEKIAAPSQSYLASFNLILHPEGL